jgi:DNA-dependent RNA polymerase auxiliary subunit epsilon
MASKLNEDLMNTNLDLPDGEIKIDGVVNPVYADAINVHKKKKKETEKVLKDKKPELKKPFLGVKGETTIMPRTPAMKKLKLSEGVFKNMREHYDDAKDAYSNIFRILDNMEYIINYINELPDEELTYEDMSQSYIVLEEALDEFKEYLEEIGMAEKRSMKEAVAVDDQPATRSDWGLMDKRNNKDLWSDIYNELVDIKDLETPHRRLKRSPKQRYSSGFEGDVRVGASRDGGIVVKANDASQLDFAKEVAETYGVDWRVVEHTSIYADPKFELFIYPYGRDVDEGLTSAQRYNRKMDKIFDDKKKRDADMVAFIKANSDASDEEINKAKDDDKVGLLLKDKGLHNKYWGKNESLKESYTEVDTIECGEETYKVVYGGVDFNKEKLVPVEDKDGNRTKLYFSDMIEFYTWYDRKGNVIYEPSMDESVKTFGAKSKKKVNEDLKIYRESDLTDFEFWSGARDTVKYLTDDEIRTIGQYLEDIYPDGCTETDINDFFWFEDDTIAEWLGYDSFEDIMNRDNEE